MSAGLMWCSYAELKLMEIALTTVDFESDFDVDAVVHNAAMALLDKVRAALAIHEREAS